MSDQIKSNIQKNLALLKSGNEKDVLLANEIEKTINNIHCFYCLDSKRLWGRRDEKHIFLGNFTGNKERFWIGSCYKCGQHEFIKDSYENEIITSNGYKMFFRDNGEWEGRFNEIKRVVEPNIKINTKPVPIIVPEISKEINQEEKPDYELVVGKKFNFDKEGISFEIGIKKIVEMLGGILQAHLGIPNLPLLKEIEASVSYESISKKKEEMFCHTTKNNECFVFVILKDSSEQKKGDFFSMVKGDKCNMHIECKYWVFKPKNKASIDECKKMMIAAATNELILLSNNLESYYEHAKNEK